MNEALILEKLDQFSAEVQSLKSDVLQDLKRDLEPVLKQVQVMIDSGIADPMGYIPVDKHTLQPEGQENVWVLGDGTDVPTSKAGAVAHFQGDVLHENIMAYITGGEQHARSDGHAV